MGKGLSHVKFAKRRTAFDVSVGIIGDKMALDFVGNRELYLPVAGRRYLLTGLDWAD